jgi:Leucine-rich repeat (LRR) protein
MKPYVFISYKSEEHIYADRVRLALEKAGVSCWMAPNSIKGGSSYAAEIPKAIRNCSAFLVVLTPKSQNSQWVTRELDRAINGKKTIIPFIVEKVKFNDDIEFYLTNVQQYFAYEDWDSELDRLIEDVCYHLKIERQREEEPKRVFADEQKKAPQKKAPSRTPQSKPQSKLGKKGWLIAAGSALLVIAAIVVTAMIIYQSSLIEICGNKYSKGIHNLRLSNQVITKKSLEGIEQLDELTTLELNGCKVDDNITTLKNINCSSLYNLAITNCNINNKLVDTLPVQNSRLSSLDISGNGNYGKLNILTKCSDSLETLNISGTDTDNLDLVANCNNLTVLIADNNNITTLSVLSGMGKLESISLADNKLANLDGLESSIHLTAINAKSNLLTNINGLKNTTLLTDINLSDNKLTSVSAVDNSSNCVKKIHLDNNRLTDIEFVRESDELEYLSASDNRIKDITPLYNKTKLSGFDLSINRIVSIDADQITGPIHYVDLSDNEIAKISGTLSFTCDYSEGCLNLEGNNLESIAFNNSGKFNYVNLIGNDITDYRSIYSGAKISYLFVTYSSELDISQLNDVVALNAYFIDCPMSKQIGVEKELSGAKFLTASEYKAQRKKLTSEILEKFDTILSNVTGNGTE